MQRFPVQERLPVTAPYRLDLTAEALRRLADNVVDVVADDGAYYRAVHCAGRLVALRVTQAGTGHLEVCATGGDAQRVRAIVARMLGVDAHIEAWPVRAARIAWLHRLACELRGLHPPRYPTMWEACAHAIVFQQISIHAAGSIMRRLVEALGARSAFGKVELVAFPEPGALLGADDAVLTAVGLSASKRAHLRAVAHVVASGAILEREIDALPTAAAADRLTDLRGIGPWSAAVVLLRGFGRLDVFPLRDSGVARTVRALSGDIAVDLPAVLETLGPVRGMLYYHLLLGRLRNLGAPHND